MEEIIKNIASTVLGGFLGYFIRLFIEHRLEIDRIKENIKLTESLRAASKFKASIIYELSGFYPISQHWDKDNFDRLYHSIPHVMSAATEFRFFVKSKGNFDTAIKNYDEYCRKTTYDAVSADTMYPEMRKEGEIGKRE